MKRAGWMIAALLSVSLVAALLAMTPLAALLGMTPLAALADDGDVAGSVVVTLAPAVKGQAPVLVTAYGEVTPGPGGETTISLPVDAQLQRREVILGQSVRAGDVLLLVALSPQAASARAQALAAVTLAKTQLAHARTLFARQLATRDQVATAENASTNAVAAAAALEDQGGAVKAPFDGVVTALPVGEGERVVAGTALVTVARPDGLVAALGVEPGDEAKIKPGQNAQLTALAGNATALAKIERVGAAIDTKTRLVDVVATAPNGWLDGEAVQATINVGTVSGWVMPRDAVLDDDQGAYLFQASGGKAMRVAVTRLGFQGDNVVVSGALDPSLSVVIAGNYQLEDGDALRVAAP